MTNNSRDWIRTIGIAGVTLIVVGALTMGSLFAANAAGVISLPAGRAGMMTGRGGHAGMMGSRGGHDGMMGGFASHKNAKHGRGGMNEFGANATANEAKLLRHIVHMLQQEQALANGLGASNPAAKDIADRRATDIITISNWLKTWYPDETVPTASSASGTVAELRQLVQHHNLMLDKAASNGTFAHPELQQWLTDSLKQRANDVSILFGSQSS